MLPGRRISYAEDICHHESDTRKELIIRSWLVNRRSW